MNKGEAQRIPSGTLVLSKTHIEAARGPYVVLITLNDGTLVCVSLDGNFSVNLLAGQFSVVSLDPEVYNLIKARAEEYR